MIYSQNLERLEFITYEVVARSVASRLKKNTPLAKKLLTVAGLAQSVERLTAERAVVGSIPGAGPILRVLK